MTPALESLPARRYSGLTLVERRESGQQEWTAINRIDDDDDDLPAIGPAVAMRDPMPGDRELTREEVRQMFADFVARSISAADVGRQIGISRDEVTRAARGNRRVSRKIAKFIGVMTSGGTCPKHPIRYFVENRK